jgi:hypothetical protein
MVSGPPLERGEINLPAEEAEEGQREDRSEWMTDASPLTGVANLTEALE